MDLRAREGAPRIPGTTLDLVPTSTEVSKGYLYLVRKTAYGAFRVYGVKEQAWLGNAWESPAGAAVLARRLNNQPSR